MNIRFLATLALLAIPATMSLPLAAGELGTQGVSPGAIDRITQVEAKCPAFSWQSDPAAECYEIAVYRLDDNVVDVRETDLETATVVLYREIPGRTTNWTPELADCFGPGERFVWFVRAVLDATTGEGTDWSDPLFFEVAAAPSVEELERAIEVLRRWEAATGGLSPTLSSAAAPVAATDTASAPVPDSGTGSGSGSGLTHLKSVTTGTAAIRGEQPDLSGETYGVVGTSASPDGAGIGAANTAGGPDLVLDGAVPAELSESGVDRPSASAQMFSITNTGGGGMSLTIEDVPVVTIETDQDTLAALSPCPDLYLAKWNGTSWVCAPDLDTDTLAALAPCTTGEVAKWTGSTWDCAPDADTLAALNCGRNEIAKWNDSASVWECAADNNTTYSFGPGLILVGGQVRLDPGLFSSRVSEVDSDGWVGNYNAVAMGADGLGLVSYHEETFGAFLNLKVAHCNNNVCSDATISTLDSTDDVGLYTSVVIGTDGLGLISYWDGTNDDLKVAHCNDMACTSAVLSTVDNAGSVGESSSIAIGTDGLGLISYYDGSSALKVAHCNDVPCTTATTSTVDAPGGWGSSVAIGTDGLGLISYRYGGTLKVAHCSDIVCTSATTSTLDGTFLGPLYDTSIGIGDDGLGLIAYYDEGSGDLKTAHCDNTLCTTASLSTVDNAGDVGRSASIVIGDDGLGMISYYDQTNGDLKVAHCIDSACTSAVINTVDWVSDVGEHTAITIGPDGRGLISFSDDTGTSYHLKVAHLPYGY